MTNLRVKLKNAAGFLSVPRRLIIDGESDRSRISRFGTTARRLRWRRIGRKRSVEYLHVGIMATHRLGRSIGDLIHLNNESKYRNVELESDTGEINMRWRGVQILIELLRFFAVIAFAVG